MNKIEEVIEVVKVAIESFAKSEETTAQEVMPESNSELVGTEESFGDNNGIPQDNEALSHQTDPGSDTLEEIGMSAAEEDAEEKAEMSPWAGFFAPIKPTF